MSWKSIAGNQTISRANLQNAIDTGVFIAKNGVPGTEPTKQITKGNVQDYIHTWELYPSFRSKASNQLPVKSNLAVQSNQIYAQGSGLLYVGNNNRSWVYSIFATGGDTWGSVASATDSRCILAGRSYTAGSGGGGAWVSNNYGESFTFLSSIITDNDASLGAAMNSYGDYMIVTRQVGSFGSQRAYIYWSYNSGVNWATGYHDTVDYNFNGAAMSGVGVYATVLGSDGTNCYVWTSNSFGSTFTKTYLCKGPKVLQGGCVAMSKSGQYQLLTPPQASSPDSGKCFLSTDYGSTWTSFYLTVPPLLPWNVFYGCSISAGGDYMSISSYSSTSGNTATWVSNDWGATWTQVGGAAVGQAVDSSGQFQYQSSRSSITYGTTWTGGISANAISVNTTTYTTPYIYGVSTGGGLYKSLDQGLTYQSAYIDESGYLTKIATSGGSNNGKYVAAILDNNPGGTPNYSLYKSYDYGNTWSSNFSSNGEVMICSAVSDDGVYWFVITYSSGSNLSYLYKSTDSGVSWQYIDFLSGQAQNCAMSNTGQYITIAMNYPNGGYYSAYVATSSNYGSTWAGYAFADISSGRTYTDVAISGHGRFRTLTSNEPVGAQLFYSSDYGVNWNPQVYLANYYSTSCAVDDSGRVGLASFVSDDNLSSYICSTTDGWDNFSSYATNIYPYPLAPPLISGVNVSSDGTYWSAVSSNSTYAFTCTTGNGSFNYQSTGITFNKVSK